MNSLEIYSAVADHYGALSSAQPSSGYKETVARSFGYTEEELDSIPSESNLGVSCGNPLAIASLREGEVVIDLGSGAGFDVFLAAGRVGPIGRVIGVDMNKDMLALAAKNKARSGAGNVSFVEARISSIPLDDGIADAIISNCVINLVPESEKPSVFGEIFRLLKPGGRLAVSDILARKQLPGALQMSAAAHVTCIGGACLVSQYQEYLGRAGFADVFVKDAKSDLNVYLDALTDGPVRKGVEGQGESGCCTPSTTSRGACCGEPKSAGQSLDLPSLATELGGIDLNEWVGSYKIFAVKPTGTPGDLSSRS